jgi:hypothetical protein
LVGLQTLTVNSSKFYCGISCGKDLNFIFKANFGYLRNSEKILPLLKESKGSVTQMETLNSGWTLAMGTDNLVLYELNIDKEKSSVAAELDLNEFEGRKSYTSSFAVLSLPNDKSSKNEEKTLEHLLLVINGKVVYYWLAGSSEGVAFVAVREFQGIDSACYVLPYSTDYFLVLDERLKLQLHHIKLKSIYEISAFRDLDISETDIISNNLFIDEESNHRKSFLSSMMIVKKTNLIILSGKEFKKVKILNVTGVLQKLMDEANFELAFSLFIRASKNEESRLFRSAKLLVSHSLALGLSFRHRHAQAVLAALPDGPEPRPSLLLQMHLLRHQLVEHRGRFRLAQSPG